MVLRLISCSPRRSGFFVTVAGGVLTADLTPASRRQDHTTLPSASAPIVHRRIRVHRIPLRVRDVAQRPSVGRDGGGYRSDLGQAASEKFGKTEKFYKGDWTRQIRSIPLDELGCFGTKILAIAVNRRRTRTATHGIYIDYVIKQINYLGSSCCTGIA